MKKPSFLCATLCFLISFCCPAAMLQAQGCYVQKDEVSGFDVTPYLPSLDSNACELAALFDSAGFAGQFKVFSFGFYAGMEHYDGYSYPQAFLDMKEQVAQESPYFLLIGRQSDHRGVFTRFWVGVEMPISGGFSCLTNEEMDGLLSDLDYILNQETFSPGQYAEKETASMDAMKSMIAQHLDCCTGGNRQVSSATLDPSKLKLTARLSGKVEVPSGTFNTGLHFVANDKVIGFIKDDATMPYIHASPDYDFGSNPFCSPLLKAVLEIRYERTCSAGAPQGNVFADTIYPVKLGNTYTFKLGKRVLKTGEEVDVVQGGLAKISVYEEGTLLKSVRFALKGENPTMQAVFSYIDSEPAYNDLWFLKKILLHETYGPDYGYLSGRMRQFKEKEVHKENLFTSWDAFSRCPNRSFDCGWGLGQLTVPVPTSQALWDWRSNIKEAVFLLTDMNDVNSKRRWVVKRFVDDNYAAVIRNWNNENPDELVEVLWIEYGGIQWASTYSPWFIGIPVFDELFPPPPLYPCPTIDLHGTSLLDACLIHCYNQGNPQILFLKVKDNGQGVKPEWEIGDNSKKYVKLVSERPVPIY